MECNQSPGGLLRAALAVEKPLQMVGAVNAYAAIMAERSGFRALYLSGAGVANSSFGLPDLGMTTLSEVLEEVRRVTAAVSLPLLVDADTGWGDDPGRRRRAAHRGPGGGQAVRAPAGKGAGFHIRNGG